MIFFSDFKDIFDHSIMLKNFNFLQFHFFVFCEYQHYFIIIKFFVVLFVFKNSRLFFLHLSLELILDASKRERKKKKELKNP
jgi:hypothetical protein